MYSNLPVESAIAVAKSDVAESPGADSTLAESTGAESKVAELRLRNRNEGTFLKGEEICELIYSSS